MAEAEAVNLRGQGNELYKSGHLLQAIQKYQDASRLVPRDPTPLGNLSAAQYEIGQYTECIETAENALLLWKDVPHDSRVAAVDKLKVRVLKAQAHSVTGPEIEQFKRRLRILDVVPRDRATMYGLEYFTAGHDEVKALYNPRYLKLGPKPNAKGLVALMFGGIGDARHLFRTIITIAQHKEPIGRKIDYHITVIDINKCRLSKNLLVFMLLDELANMEEDSDEAMITLTTIFYIWITTLMPKCAYHKLLSTIDRALLMLEAGEQPLKWAYLLPTDFQAYIEVLSRWRGTTENVFSNSKVIELVTSQLSHFKSPYEPTMPHACTDEQKLYIAAAVLVAPKRLLEAHDPVMLELLTKYSTKPRTHAQKFKNYVKRHWHFNVTLCDLEWYNSLVEKDEYDFGFNPFDTLEQFSEEPVDSQPNRGEAISLYDFLAPFFIETSKGIKKIGDQLKVEVVLGDYIDFTEKVRFGLFNNLPSDSGQHIRPTSFPVTYARIHLSNIPDYTNGHLSTFLYAAPLLQPRKSSFVTSTCLRNPGSWRHVEDFMTEYQRIIGDHMLRSLTNIEVVYGGRMMLPMGEYTKYRYRGTSPQAFGDLLPRTSFNRWFYGLFFRLALPFNQDLSFSPGLILSPVNLTLLFRQITHLRTLGYPSHWLSENLLSIIENKVTTTSRPPRESPSSKKAVDEVHPNKKLETAPFSHEMAILARIFSPLLPFALPSIPIIPPEDTIYKYTFTLPDHHKTARTTVPSAYLTLIFWNRTQIISTVPAALNDFRHDLRPALDSSYGDEVIKNRPGFSHYKDKNYHDLRRKGIVVWSTVAWDMARKEASAWMGEKLVDGMCDGHWKVGMFRTDSWTPVSDPDRPNAVKTAMKRGEKWMVDKLSVDVHRLSVGGEIDTAD